MFKGLVAKLNSRYIRWTFIITVLIMNIPLASQALAASAGNYTIGDGVSGIDWPWTRFLNSLAKQLTGPLPLTLGTLGLAAAAIALFAGNGGAGTHKFILLIFAVSTCLFAPSFIGFISDSTSGMTINAVLGVIHP